MPDAKYMIRKSHGLDEIKEKEGFLSECCGNDGHILKNFILGVSSRHAKCIPCFMTRIN
ncbi:hypothetical protein [Bacillus infantis]|uniref:hypothetical protein n=1 Tax=Bacillus infantis TaxID=324767 RepID=UPI001653D175|nr:hypothetical protein [Bacillus infantis]